MSHSSSIVTPVARPTANSSGRAMNAVCNLKRRASMPFHGARADEQLRATLVSARVSAIFHMSAGGSYSSHSCDCSRNPEGSRIHPQSFEVVEGRAGPGSFTPGHFRPARENHRMPLGGRRARTLAALGIVVALGTVTACGHKEQRGETSTATPSAAPSVELLQQGAEPRELLRFAVTEGTESRATMRKL
jgi:hypothetical protein